MGFSLKETVIINIKLNLENKNMTMYELAKRLKVSRQAVHQLLDKNANPTLDTIEKIAKVIGIPPHDLFKPIHL